MVFLRGLPTILAQKVHSPNLLLRKCISEVARICITIIFHLSKLWKAKLSLLCDVIFLVGLKGKFDIDHSQVPHYFHSGTLVAPNFSWKKLLILQPCMISEFWNFSTLALPWPYQGSKWQPIQSPMWPKLFDWLPDVSKQLPSWWLSLKLIRCS